MRPNPEIVTLVLGKKPTEPVQKKVNGFGV
jgi:hypothetical protein